MSAFWTDVLVVAGINAIAAWGLGLAVRSGQLSVGHAALAGIGGYFAGFMFLRGVGIIVTVVAGMAVAGLCGAGLAALTQRLNHLFLALATLVFGEIAVLAATQTSAIGGAAGMVGLPLLDLPVIVGAIVIGIALLEILLIHGSGLELRATLLATDPQLVELGGVSARAMRVVLFAISAAVAGLSGVLYAYHNGVLQPVDLGFARSLDLLVYAVVGGAASGYGPMLGAIVLTVLPQVLGLQGRYATLLLGGVLLATMLVRRDGLIGRPAVRILARHRTGVPPETTTERR